MLTTHLTGSSGFLTTQSQPISFDSAKSPMLKSAELLGFSSLPYWPYLTGC
jgi:hypothetical protein